MPNPISPSTTPTRELTARALVLGAVLTLVFTAANVYFGLKAGLTFATSIPAAVISMAILRRFSDVTVQENNIVQTVASAAGTLSSIIFVLPGLVMVGWWTGFPFTTSFLVCALGGVLGVMYSIPLRRALVLHSALPYPEGVACAEVLKVGAGDRLADGSNVSQAGFRSLLLGSIASTLFAVIVATQIFASDVVRFFRFGKQNGATGFDLSLSFALFAVGHLVGLWVGLAILLGALISWAGAVPYFTQLMPQDGGAASDVATAVWSHKVRFIGAGTIGVAAVWTLLQMIAPILAGLRSALAASKQRETAGGAVLARVEQDIPIGLVGAVTLACMVPIAWLLYSFGVSSGLGDVSGILLAGGIAYVALMSFFVAAVCGYMAGLIGSSNSPLSGVGILVVVGAALLLVLFVKPLLPATAGPALVAFALFVTAVIFTVATISNDNLQDLKTGQLVDATPWRQQVALIVGVIAGAAVIPPILNLLNQAYGFAGAPGALTTHALSAPQAALISALAQGVIQGNLDWNPIGLGAALGALLIAVDEGLRRATAGRAYLPPLAVGLGIYLPTAVTLMTVTGAIVGWFYDKRAARTAEPDQSRQLGVLLASGMIVGESLIGVLIAAVVVLSGTSAPLALVGDEFASLAMWIGGGVFVAILFGMYGWLNRMSGPVQDARRR